MDLVSAYRHLKKEEEPLTCGAVILGAGSAQRMGFDKMTVMLDGQPVLVRAVNAFEQSPLVQEIVVVTKADRIEEIAFREVAPLLLQQSFRPKDPTVMRKTMALVKSLGDCIRFYRLFCNMEPEAALVAWNGMKNNA